MALKLKFYHQPSLSSRVSVVRNVLRIFSRGGDVKKNKKINARTVPVRRQSFTKHQFFPLNCYNGGFIKLGARTFYFVV